MVFALVAPVFIPLIFAMEEFGRMVMVDQLPRNASRHGARRAVLVGSTVAAVQDVVEPYLAKTTATVAAQNNSVTPDPAVAAFGDPFTVSVTVPFGVVSWLPVPM